MNIFDKDMNKFSEFFIHYKKTIRAAFKKQAMTEEQFIIVLDDDNKAIGVVTDGDFRRAIWDSVPLEAPVETITNRNPVFFSEDYSAKKVNDVFLKTNIRQIPILKNGTVMDIIFKSRFFNSKPNAQRKPLDLPVVIMAGGAGTRLAPFTRILPKPLIPVGEKPVIEIILDNFVNSGMNNFFISLNHKAKMVKIFLEDFGKKYNISYLEEKKILGTVGALKFLEGKIKSPFFVSNCDILIKEDYANIYKFHKRGKYALTLVGSMQHHVIPYGVCQVGKGRELESLKEKPSYDMLVNTGMYIINPETLKHIPAESRFDIAQLIDAVKQNGEKLGIYPISEKSWIDIGQWEEYKEAVDKLQHFI